VNASAATIDTGASTRLRRVLGWVQQRRTALLFLGAVAFGAAAVVGARSYISERLALERERLVPRFQMVDLVVAKRDLKRGDVIGPDTMAVRSLPRDYAPGGAVSPARFESLVGSRLAAPMKSGEPLLPGALIGADAPGFSSRVRPGIRALTIAVDEVNSLSGMLQPGDRIDLMISVRPQPVSGVVQPELTRTLMQDVLVLATGRQIRASGDDGPANRTFTTITVEVDPERAQKLVVAQRSGKLTAVLRHPDDRQPVGDRRLDVNTLLGLPTPAAVVQRPGPEVIVGGRGALPAAPTMPGHVGDGAAPASAHASVLAVPSAAPSAIPTMPSSSVTTSVTTAVPSALRPPAVIEAAR